MNGTHMLDVTIDVYCCLCVRRALVSIMLYRWFIGSMFCTLIGDFHGLQFALCPNKLIPLFSVPHRWPDIVHQCCCVYLSARRVIDSRLYPLTCMCNIVHISILPISVSCAHR